MTEERANVIKSRRAAGRYYLVVTRHAPRAVITVPKKVCRRAVDRNLEKRKLRAIFRELSAEKRGVQVTVLRETRDAPFSGLVTEIATLLEKVNRTFAL